MAAGWGVGRTCRVHKIDFLHNDSGKTSFYSFIVLVIKKNTKMAIQPMATLFGDAQKLGKLAQV